MPDYEIIDVFSKFGEVTKVVNTAELWNIVWHKNFYFLNSSHDKGHGEKNKFPVT